MLVTFGKHDGKSVEWLVLKESDYIKWILSQSASGKILQIQKHAAALVKKFDAKPLLNQCRAEDCSEKAIRATVYLDNLLPEWWCAECNPYQLGANAGKLQSISTYSQALTHVELYCRGRKSDSAEIIKYLAQAKGLPSRVSESHAQAFFS